MAQTKCIGNTAERAAILRRTEQLAENLMAADVDINAKELGKEQSGTAVLILARSGGAWKLAGIDLFEVR